MVMNFMTMVMKRFMTEVVNFMTSQRSTFRMVRIRQVSLLMVQYVFALYWWIGIGWLSAHESPTKGEYLFPHDALLKDPAQAMGLNASDCTTSEPSLGSSVKGRGGLEELLT